MKNYPKIDLCRLFCAFLVVWIHCLEIKKPFPVSNMIVTCLSGQAVPFFFITSGFFYGKKLLGSADQKTVIRKYVMHNLLLYGAWLVLEFPGMVAQYNRMYPDASLLKLAALLLRRGCFAGQGVYWYVLVLAETGLIAGLLVMHKKEKVLYGLGWLGFALCFVYKADLQLPVLKQWNQLVYVVFSWDNNFLMRGLPYMALGIWFARNEDRLAIPGKVLVGSYLTIAAAALLFYGLVQETHRELLRFLYLDGLLAGLLFLFARTPSDRKIPAALSTGCREISSCLYFLHTVFIYNVADRFWPLDAPMPLRYAIAAIPPVLVWCIVRKLDWKPLKWMLSMK